VDNPASPQRTPTPAGTVHGFVAGPGHSMEFLNGATIEEGFIDQAIASTGVS
jgi:hypothetical protein